MTEAEVRGLFGLVNVPVQALWKLPNRYLGELLPLPEEDIRRDTSSPDPVVRMDDRPDHPTQNVVLDWMREYRWRAQRPSWLVLTPFGLVELGWRKRVIEIVWVHTNVRAVVTEDDVTKDQTHVHAWTVEKAVEYLRAWALAAQITRSSAHW